MSYGGPNGRWVPPRRRWRAGPKTCSWVFGALVLLALIPTERTPMLPGELGFPDILLIAAGVGFVVSLAAGWFTAE